MKTYSEIGDILITALKADAAAIGIEESNIIEGGEELSPPSINIHLEPKIANDTPENNTIRFAVLSCSISIQTAGFANDALARRDAIKKAWAVKDVIDKTKLNIIGIVGFQFIIAKADYSWFTVEFETNFKKE